MIYAIIAAGEGSRLTEEGYSGLKPMIQIKGKMIIDRLIDIFINNSATSIIIIINEKSEALQKHLQDSTFNIPIQLFIKNTESSLHSFYEILKLKNNDEEFCLSTIDTIFNETEFSLFIDTFHMNDAVDGLMAVTSFIDDESPLYVNFNSERRITSFTDIPTPSSLFVSGGIYCFRKEALKVVHESIGKGVARMRNLQRELLNNDLALKAFPFSKIIDIDHVADIAKAEAFLNETSNI